MTEAPKGLPNKLDWDQVKAYKMMLFDRLQVEAKPGVWKSYLEGLQSHPKQAEFHFPTGENERPLIPGSSARSILVAGQRSGKTIALCAEYVVNLALGGVRLWHCAPTYDLCGRGFDYVKRWVGDQRVLGEDCFHINDSKDGRRVTLYKGSQVESFLECRSTDPGKGYRQLVGEQLDGAGWDECAGEPEEVWTQYLQLRLMNRKGWGAFTSSPKDFNWFWQYSERGVDPEFQEIGWRTIQFPMLANPFIDPQEIENLRKTMSDAEFRRDVMGEFVSFEGLCWPMFRDRLYNAKDPGRGGQLYDPAVMGPDPEECTVYRSVDTGVGHNAGCLWAMVERETNDVYIFRDYDEKRDTHYDHAEEISAMTLEDVFVTWAGKDAKRRSGTGEYANASASTDYRRAGINLRPGMDDPGAVRDGISKVGHYLKSTLEDKPAHPRLFISVNCKKLRDGIRRYVRRSRPGIYGQVTEQPIKYRDEMAECLRRLCAPMPKWRPPMRRAFGFVEKDPQGGRVHRTGLSKFASVPGRQ